MDRLHRLLVGIDLDDESGRPSSGSLRAAEQARALAQRTGASICLLHAAFYEHSPEQVAADAPGDATSSVAASAVEVVEELVREATEAGTDAEASYTHERPWLAIVHAVLREQADLVLVGKRTEKAGDGRRLGTTAANLLRSCPSPVWVVDPEQRIAYDRVLAAADLTPVGDRVTEFAGYLAGLYEAELHVVHAYAIPLQFQMTASGRDDAETLRELQKIEQRARDHIESCLETRGVGVKPSLHIGCTSPHRAIQECLERLQPDLVVMGIISRGSVAGLLVGTTAERVLHRVECSLLTVKPENFVSPVTLD